jgi:dihydroorotate dehydrogenase
MSKPVERMALSLLRRLDPERAHRVALKLLTLLPPSSPQADDPALAVHALGLHFPNPVGLAPGFDKDGEAFDAALRLGFGFVEIGTVTPRPQAGNPRPRLFRLDTDAAVINRLGFNSAGAAVVRARLVGRAGRVGIVGVNIGANRDSPDRISDYVTLVEVFSPLASYFTVNISSPNTPGLRDLQQAKMLDELLARVLAARDRSAGHRRPTPVLVKIAPDLALADLDDIVAVARRRGIDGMIVANTTVRRPPGLQDKQAQEAGGLSGRPLFPLATRMLAETFVRVEGAFPLVGVGGIDSGASAYEKVRAGATLLQLYTGLVFRGLQLVSEIKTELQRRLHADGHRSLADAVGLDARRWTAEPWEF